MNWTDWINKFRERVNIRIYGSKNSVLRVFRILSTLFSIAALLVALYYYGYPQTPASQSQVFVFFKSFFLFYVFHFGIRFLYDFQPQTFFKNHRLETILSTILVVEGISDYFTGELFINHLFEKLGIYGFSDWTAVGIVVYILVGIFFDFALNKRSFIAKIKVHPATIFIAIFVLIIFLGTGMLMLPEMTKDGLGMNWLDAFFTSTSATCVTGLIVEDTATFFTFKGQLVILSLIKLGGLNIISFAAFMALFIKLGIRVKQHEVLDDFINKQNLLAGDMLFGRIFLLSVFVELLGALGILLAWPAELEFATFGEKIFFSVFHSMSAFNNAGFSIFTENLAGTFLQQAHLLHFIIAVLIFVGGLGMPALLDMTSFRRLRERLHKPWLTYTVSTKIALYTSLSLVAFGTLALFLLESNGVFSSFSTGEQLVHAFFSSVTTRTAGFNTIDFADFGVPALLLIIVLMFIGASSGSTGGGIKTSTFYLLIASTISTLQGRPHIEFQKRTIPTDLVYKAFSVLVFTIVAIFIGTFILSITEADLLQQEGRNLMDLLFEEVSAFSTVGLSMGVTPQLSDAGRLVIIASMFIGRIGTLTLGFALARNLSDLKYKYPSAHITVG